MSTEAFEPVRRSRPLRRWGDVNHHWGPFTWSPERTGHGWGMMLDSGNRRGGDDFDGCHLRIYLGKRTLLIELPPIARPIRIKRMLTYQTMEDTAKRAAAGLPDHYFDEFPREYGFSLNDGVLHVHYGPQTMGWSSRGGPDSTASKCFFLPWLSWRHVRHSYYTADGAHLRSFFDRHGRSRQAREERRYRFEDQRNFIEKYATTDFAFDDFDGERLYAATRIEEREWRFGTGLFAWLSLFVPAKISRSLDIRFSDETGRRKGSWKGGTVGHSTDMLPGETPTTAFLRYCDEHGMKFIGPAPLDRAVAIVSLAQGGAAMSSPVAVRVVDEGDKSFVLLVTDAVTLAFRWRDVRALVARLEDPRDNANQARAAVAS